MDEDRISSCPDLVLERIIALLDTRDAICTSVLSKRWRFLWTTPPFIRLDEKEFRDALRRGNMLPSVTDDEFRNEDKLDLCKALSRKFILAVDSVLYSNTAPSLEVFDVSFFAPSNRLRNPYNKSLPLNRWVNYVTTKKGVKKLSIKFSHSRGRATEVLDFDLVKCQTINCLELHCCSISSHTSCKNFTSIETLHLRKCHWTSRETIASFFTSCPSLRSCTIENLLMGGYFIFLAPWLKVLELIDLRTYGAYLEIHAPNLEYFCIESSSWSPTIRFPTIRIHNMQSLTGLKLKTKYYPVKDFLRMNMAELGRVKELFITYHELNGFHTWRAENDEAMPANQFDSLEKLMVSDFNLSYVDALASLLDATPQIRKLTLKDPSAKTVKNYGNLSCESLKKLKQIRLVGGVHEGHLQLVEFLLKNASTLESFEMNYKYESHSCRLALVTKLLALPRSGSCGIYIS